MSIVRRSLPSCCVAAVTALAFLLLGAAPADAGSWTRHGPSAGRVTALAVDPTNPNVVYAGTGDPGGNSGSVYRSTNGGVTWTEAALPEDDVDPGFDRAINMVVVAPANPSVVYMCALSGGSRSTDAGLTWTGVGLLNPRVIAVDPGNAQHGYAIENGSELSVTTDGFASTSTLPRPVPEYALRSVAVAPSAPTTVYLGTYFGVYRSTTSGSSWVSASAGLTSSSVTRVIVDPSTAATVYALTPDGIFKTTDSGSSWSAANVGLPSLVVDGLAIDPATPTTLYAATDAGLAKSIDGGESWSTVLSGVEATHAVEVSASNPSIVYAGVEGLGVLKSTDAGATWNVMNEGIRAAFVEDLLADTIDPDVMWAAGPRLWKTVDHGATWTIALDEHVSSLARDPSDPAVIYAGGIGAWKSIDGGATWNPSGTGLPASRVFVMRIAPSAPSTLYAATESDGVYKSIDGGASWNPVNGGLPSLETRSIAVSPTDPNLLLLGTEGDGAFRSTNGGTSWTANLGSLYYAITEVRFDPTAAGVAYLIMSDASLHKSTDGGLTWQQLFYVLNSGLVLAFDPATPGTIFSSGRVARSLNFGESFVQVDERSPATTTAVAVGAGDPNALYVGTTGRGVWTFAPQCGDGHLDVGEACDDGNLTVGDGCSPTCAVVESPTNPVPGKGSPSTDCWLELLVSPPGTPDPKKGVPVHSFTCTLDDPSCDAVLDDFSCTFLASICLNVTDGRLLKSGVPACAPTDVKEMKMKAEINLYDGAAQLGAAYRRKCKGGPTPKAFCTVDAQCGAGGRCEGEASSLFLPPVTATDVCSGPQIVVVTPFQGKPGKVSLKIKTLNGAGKSDSDKINFTCLP